MITAFALIAFILAISSFISQAVWTPRLISRIIELENEIRSLKKEQSFMSRHVHTTGVGHSSEPKERCFAKC